MIALDFLKDECERVDAATALALTAPDQPMQAAEAHLVVTQLFVCSTDAKGAPEKVELRERERLNHREVAVATHGLPNITRHLALETVAGLREGGHLPPAQDVARRDDEVVVHERASLVGARLDGHGEHQPERKPQLPVVLRRELLEGDAHDAMHQGWRARNGRQAQLAPCKAQRLNDSVVMHHRCHRLSPRPASQLAEVVAQCHGRDASWAKIVIRSEAHGPHQAVGGVHRLASLPQVRTSSRKSQQRKPVRGLLRTAHERLEGGAGRRHLGEPPKDHPSHIHEEHLLRQELMELIHELVVGHPGGVGTRWNAHSRRRAARRGGTRAAQQVRLKQAREALWSRRWWRLCPLHMLE